MVGMHPFTLQFYDEEYERELRNGTRNASYRVLGLFFLLDILCRAVLPLLNAMFDPAPDTSAFIKYTAVALTYTTVAVVMRHAYFLPWDQAAKMQDLLWLGSWVINVAVWWAMVLCGLARRLTEAEGQGAAVVCAMWGFVMVLQHVIHIGFRARMVVVFLGATMALTSQAWRKEMLAALLFGEAVGYSIEHMLRSSYLPRANRLENARIAKERSDYDLQMLVHSRTRSNSRDRPPSSRSGSQSDGSVRDPPAAPDPPAIPVAQPTPIWTVAWLVNEVQTRACSMTASSTASSHQGRED